MAINVKNAAEAVSEPVDKDDQEDGIVVIIIILLVLHNEWLHCIKLLFKESFIRLLVILIKRESLST